MKPVFFFPRPWNIFAALGKLMDPDGGDWREHSVPRSNHKGLSSRVTVSVKSQGERSPMKAFTNSTILPRKPSVSHPTRQSLPL